MFDSASHTMADMQEFLPMAGLNLNDTLRLASIW